MLQKWGDAVQSWVKQVLMVVIAVVAVWLLVIFYWRANAHMPSTSDIVVYLLVALGAAASTSK